MKPEEILGRLLIEKHLTIATAESCTGGLLSSKLTDISGSSDYIKLNFVTYANDAKNEILGVSWDILNSYGAVSEQCAQSMADGLQAKTNCDIALCTTGIAGPTGGTKEKPVGLVYISAKYNGELYKKLFDDFYKLVREINTAGLRTRKTPIITIKFFYSSRF